MGSFDAQVSDNVSVGIGYGGYNVDNEKGSGYQKFVCDTTMYGPVLGASFKW